MKGPFLRKVLYFLGIFIVKQTYLSCPMSWDAYCVTVVYNIPVKNNNIVKIKLILSLTSES